MNRYLTLLFFGLLPAFTFARETQYSALYFNNGKLSAYTMLGISAEQYKVWRQAELNATEVISSSLNSRKLLSEMG